MAFAVSVLVVVSKLQPLEVVEAAIEAGA
jgi:hypothetical protein